MSNKINQNLPSMTPDRDQVEAFKSTRTGSSTRAKSESRGYNNETYSEAKPSSSGGNTLLTLFVLLIASAAGYAGWWFYEKDLKTQAIIAASEKRIAQLEQQLSVTGEEMGESTGAMKVRLEKLTKRTEDLWAQMDKLWASAWRRNQADITKVATKVKTQSGTLSKHIKQSKATGASIKAIIQQQTETEFSLGMLTEQVQEAQKLKSQLQELENKLATLQSKTLGGDKKQIEVAGNVSQLNASLNSIIKRLQRLESQLNGVGTTP